jgi:hypothetical protein
MIKAAAGFILFTFLRVKLFIDKYQFYATTPGLESKKFHCKPDNRGFAAEISNVYE